MRAFQSLPPALYYNYYQKNKDSWDQWLFGERTRKKIQQEKITKALGILLAIIAGFCCGVIAAVSLGTVFPALASYYWLLGTVLLSGVVLEGSVYGHHLSSIFTDIIFHGFFRSIENTLVIHHLLKNKDIRKKLLTHYVRLSMGRIKETQSTCSQDVTHGELYHLLAQCQMLSESALKTLLLRFIQSGDSGDVAKYSPTYDLTKAIRQTYKNALQDPLIVREIRWKKRLCTLSTLFAVVAGIGLGSIMYTDALHTLSGIAALTSSAPYLAIGIALLMGFAYTFFMIYALREVIVNDLIQHFWRSLKEVIRPTFIKQWNPNTSLLEKSLGWLFHVIKCALLITPFILLCAAAVLVSVSMGKLLIDSSTNAFTNLATFISKHVGSHVGNIAHWIASGEIIAGRNIIQVVSEVAITLFFIPSDIMTTLIYGFESVKDILQNLVKVITGQYNLWPQLNEQLAYHQEDKALFLKTGVKTCMWLVLVTFMVIHLAGEASIAGRGAEDMMGGDVKDHPEIGSNSSSALMVGQVIAYIDLILEILTHIPFLVGGESEDHDHGTGVIGGMLNFFRGIKHCVTSNHRTCSVPQPTRISHGIRELTYLVNTAIENEKTQPDTQLSYSQLFHNNPYFHQRSNACFSPFDDYKASEYNTLEKHVVGVLMERCAEAANRVHVHCC